MNNISRTFPPPPLRPQRFPVPGVSRGIKGGRTFGPDGGGWWMGGGFDGDGDGDGVPDGGGGCRIDGGDTVKTSYCCYPFKNLCQF